MGDGWASSPEVDFRHWIPTKGSEVEAGAVIAPIRIFATLRRPDLLGFP